MNKILPLCLLIFALTVLSSIGRTSGSTTPAVTNQFTLIQSYPVSIGEGNLIATIYRAGEGSRQKEILSIWSNESYGYELQYIKTAPAGGSFLRPSMLRIQDMNFLNIAASEGADRVPVNVATLWIAPDESLHDVTARHARELLKIRELQKH